MPLQVLGKTYARLRYLLPLTRVFRPTGSLEGEIPVPHRENTDFFLLRKFKAADRISEVESDMGLGPGVDDRDSVIQHGNNDKFILTKLRLRPVERGVTAKTHPLRPEKMLQAIGEKKDTHNVVLIHHARGHFEATNLAKKLKK